MLSSSGADAHYGVAALHGWGQAARVLVQCSGVVPVLAGVTGPAISGIALLIGLADIVVMSNDAYAFVSGPVPVREMTGVAIGPDELGGAPIHASASGAASAITEPGEVLDALNEILAYLPAHCDELPPRLATADRRDRLTPEAGDLLPSVPAGAYDVRDVVSALVDDGVLVELRARWAPNLVTGLASLDGYSVGILANQPMSIAGTLDIAASQKGARFVNFCDAFGLPLVTLVDTPGFYPGKDLEWRGDDPSRRTAGVRICAGDRAPSRRRAAQVLRRRLHRHGLQDDGQRRVPGVAQRRARGDGRLPSGPDPAPWRRRRRRRHLRLGLRGHLPQPLRGRRARATWTVSSTQPTRVTSSPRRSKCCPPSVSACDTAATTTLRSEPEPTSRWRAELGTFSDARGGPMPEDSFTITDNRSGQTVTVPVVDGTISATALRELDTGLWFYDPSYLSTANCNSRITYIDGDEGILRYRGYPIEQLAEQSSFLEVAYLLIHGELPTEAEAAEWIHHITFHTYVHEDITRFIKGFRYDAHPMGTLVSTIAALSTFLPRGQGHRRSVHPGWCRSSG